MRYFNGRLISPFFSFGVLMLLASCGGSESQSTNNFSGGKGAISISVTDAPIDSSSKVVVEFSGVSIKPENGEAIEFTFDEARSIDLLSLQGNLSESLLENETIPAGNYNWIRLHVNAEDDGILDSYIETESGTQLELYVPSGSQSGLKLVRGFTVAAGGLTDFTVDFDLRKSIVKAPEKSGSSVKLKPTLRLIDNVMVGSISGTIDANMIIEACDNPALEMGAVYVYTGADVTPLDVSGANTDPLTTALVSFDGETYGYEVGFLITGEYTLAYTCDAAQDDPELVDELEFIAVEGITVEEGTEVFLDFTSMLVL